MKEEHAKVLADAYCDGVCKTGLAGLCPGDGCCETYPHNLKHFMTADIGHIAPDKIDTVADAMQKYCEECKLPKEECNGSDTCGVYQKTLRDLMNFPIQTLNPANKPIAYEYMEYYYNWNENNSDRFNNMGKEGWQVVCKLYNVNSDAKLLLCRVLQ